MQKKIRVLHITPDDKFFDPVYATWEKNNDLENKALFIAPKRNYEFKYIKRIDSLEIYYKRTAVKDRLQKDDYDVVFLHSMPYEYYKFVTWIPKDRKVIWWGWGYDIYESQAGLPPIVNLKQFKPKTLKFVGKLHFGPRTIKLMIKHLILRNYMRQLQETAISRIDYYQPVIKQEMKYLQDNNFFRAKEFYYMTNPPVLENFSPRPVEGNIILGNSATSTNNHLDVLEILQNLKCESQTIVMPLAYGNNKYKKWLENKLNRVNVQTICDFMPSEKYFQLMDKCSYAVYGTIRQQAMGNVSHAIAHGIKVFLYKDSVAYQNHKALGYVVFAIEDMTKESLRTPLTKDQMEHNNMTTLKEYNRRVDVYKSFMNEVKSTASYRDLLV